MADPYATVTPQRRERVARAQELRARGLLQREIADVMGLGRTAVGDLLSDPDNEKKRARRLYYGLPCPRCGTPMDGSGGTTGSSPAMCRECAAVAHHEARYWTQDTIVEALRTFRERVGRNPTAVDVMVKRGAPSIERRLSSERVAEIAAIPSDLKLPHPALVKREFGSWNAALQAAGLPINRTGAAAHRVTKRKGVMDRRYVAFNKNGHGWVPKDTVDARNPEEAIQLVADAEGTYVAVAEPYWQERSVAPKTVFAVVDS